MTQDLITHAADNAPDHPSFDPARYPNLNCTGFTPNDDDWDAEQVKTAMEYLQQFYTPTTEPTQDSLYLAREASRWGSRGFGEYINVTNGAMIYAALELGLVVIPDPALFGSPTALIGVVAKADH
jgi:hypothetical protein